MIRRGGYKPAPGTRRAQPKDWRAEVALEQTHAQLVLDIAKYLRLMGWCVLVTPRGGIPGAPGWPDIFAFRAGRVLFIEVKVGRDKMDVDQLRVKGELEARGYQVLEARSLDEVITATKLQTSAKV